MISVTLIITTEIKWIGVTLTTTKDQLIRSRLEIKNNALFSYLCLKIEVCV